MNGTQRRISRLTRNDPGMDLRWWLVPTVVLLLVLAALLSWPQMSARPDNVARHASAAPAPSASVALAATTTPADDTVEDNHAPTF